MNMDANRTTSGGYQLHDELARFCLPAANRDASRKLAWTNSICLLFLIIGLTGGRQAGNFTEPPPRVEEAVPTIIEPIKPPPSAVVQKVQASDQNQSAAPQVVAVTLDTPAINFAVPTIGNLLVPNALAQAPSVAGLVSRPRVVRVGSTGESGDRPQPPYPPIALAEGEQGSVAVSFTVDETGVVTDIALKESSGYPVLDRSTIEFIKRHWILPPVNGSHQFETTLIYKIAVN
jgi:protein TonB